MRLPIYLDYAATTPVDPRVAEKMAHYLTLDGVFGNPASHTHPFGRAAQAAVEDARHQVAALLNADPGDIIWTSGATESNNLAIKGAALASKSRHLVTCKTEHRSVLDPCRQLERAGYHVTYLDPEPNGLLALQKLEAALRDDTVLVSIMHVNNETGVIQDLAAIGALTRQRGILFHVDAAQSLGKLPLDVQTLPVDLMSLNAHKVYGPKGIGALYVRRRLRTKIAAQIHGGGHEQGLRSGTLATHQIVGMGEACRIAREEMASDDERIRGLRDRLWDGLRRLPAVYLNGDPQRRVAGILNVSFAGVGGESLLAALTDLAVSAGSACNSAENEPSHVLRALGVEDQLARSSIRFSLGRFTTRPEIDHAVAQLHEAVAKLRELSPLWESSPRNDRFAEEDAAVGTGLVDALGDVIKLQIKVNDCAIIEDACFKAQGTVAAIAAASLASTWVRGKTLAAAKQIHNREIAEALSLPPEKIHCAVLAERAIAAALANYAAKRYLTDVERLNR